MKCSGRQAQKSRHADARLSNFREHPRNSCQAATGFLYTGISPLQPPYRYRGSHSVMPGQIYMMTMHTTMTNM